MTTEATQAATAADVQKAKPGFKTSEFYLSGIAQLLGYIVGLGIIPTESIWSQAAGFILGGLASLGYSISRGMAKK